MSKNVNVKVEMNNAGEVKVFGLNKDGSVSAVNYNVVETVGLTDLIDARIAAALAKASEPKASEPKQKESSAPKQKEEKNMKGYNSVKTNGATFTNIKGFKHEGIFHAVKFEVAGKGDCIVGFAKDRNQFIEHFNGVNKEVTRADVVKRLAKYEGKDAAQLVKMIQTLKPVTMAAGVCSCCGASLTRSVKEYSVRNYGVALCRPCQDNNKPSKKGAERSEAPKSSKETFTHHNCACGEVISKAYDMCGRCENNYKEQMSREYFEDVCSCGNTKERAFDECEECRENKWSVEDKDQMTFKDARLLAEQEAMDMLNEDPLPEFYLGYDSEVSATEEDKKGKRKGGGAKRSGAKKPAQKTDAAAGASEERNSEAEASSSSKGEAVAADPMALFDESELVVNAGLKGICGVDAEPVE